MNHCGPAPGKMVRGGLSREVAFQRRLRDEKLVGEELEEEYSIQVEGTASATNRRKARVAVVMREVVVQEEFGKVGWGLVGPVGRRRNSLDFILSVIE